LDAFIHHQGRALEETGKAFASLLPKDFRTHVGNALEEGKAGLEVVADAMIDGVQCTLDKLHTTKPADEPGKDKVKVDVD
jgi:hypothetical protein